MHQVPTALVKAIIRCESDFNPRAFSRAGAIGLMQVMPFSARRVGIAPDELWKPAQNILACARLPAILLRYYDGVSALVAYNARPRKVFAPLPRNGETPRYLAAVLKYFRAYLDTLPSLGHRVEKAQCPSVHGRLNNLERVQPSALPQRRMTHGKQGS